MSANQSIIVLGCTGMLGHKLLQVLSATTDYRIYGTVRSADSDRLGKLTRSNKVTIVPGIHADNLAPLAALIREVRPVAVINCVGLIKQLPEGSQAIPNIKINALFPHQVAELTREVGSRLFHFSTDCVYSGTKGFYSETDSTDPQDLYGKSKAIGEISGPGCVTIRSSIIGPELNSKFGLFEWFCSQKGKTVKGYRKALYTGFTTQAMADIVLMLIQKFPDFSGIWNVASQPISKFEILELINEVLDLGITIEEDNSYAMNRSLDGSKFEQATGFKPPTWRQMIEDLKRDEDIKRRFTGPLSFCVVLPMYNEEACARKCVLAIHDHLKNLKLRTAIIAVNDGSKDRTLELLTGLQEQVPGLIVENHVINQGYGGANITGANRGYRDGFKYILFMDGDLTQRASYIDDFVTEMQKGTDYIKATRYSKGGGVDGVPFDRWFISYVGNKLAKLFFRLPLNDYTNGFRAIRAEFVPKIKCSERGFAYLIEEIAQIAKLGKSFGEVPYTLTVRQEEASVSKFNYSFRTYFKYLKHLVKK